MGGQREAGIVDGGQRGVILADGGNMGFGSLSLDWSLKIFILRWFVLFVWFLIYVYLDENVVSLKEDVNIV